MPVILQIDGLFGTVKVRLASPRVWAGYLGYLDAVWAETVRVLGIGEPILPSFWLSVLIQPL